MYITKRVYRSLVKNGVAAIAKEKDDDDPWVRRGGERNPVKLKSSFLDAVETYRLEIAHVAFGNVFVKAVPGSLVYGYERK